LSITFFKKNMSKHRVEAPSDIGTTYTAANIVFLACSINRGWEILKTHIRRLCSVQDPTDDVPTSGTIHMATG